MSSALWLTTKAGCTPLRQGMALWFCSGRLYATVEVASTKRQWTSLCYSSGKLYGAPEGNENVVRKESPCTSCEE